MNKPHKHAALIKAWADGAEIEAYCPVRDAWDCTTSPDWDEDTVYRVKPVPPTYGEIANRAWQEHCDWDAVANAVLNERERREYGDS